MLAGALLAAASLGCAAAPFAVRLGSEKIVLDAPPGFSDTGDLASPRLNDLAATLTPASNKILLFGLTDADYLRFTKGDQLEWNRYLIAVTPKGLEQVRVTPAQFSGLVTDTVRGLDKPVQVQPADLVKFLEKEPIGKVSVLSELKREESFVSALQATRLPPLPGETFWQKDKPQYMCFTTTLMLVKGRALQLAVYLVFEREPDVEWLKQTTERWVLELQRLNK